ncbi:MULTISPECIES: YcaO-like family protein [unclassified Streptococcus]|uniref:YcaO-like family protein n=1 Tax=unclassified Streptococcus TaxID=2608887 RepID=UPI001071C3E4|nr:MULTISPECIES: YcaO-like family protein [unclassified Streptococcus]MBF0787077.1 YcaO-like family protein [Streptococcus sp. 19428wC2_LYSM12]MCQ9211365.1 YcaO-like family protein [Streptococcus sp. B01]MCQ9214677.1 YcaO-like family protein [Streptococcus sp. O1]TFV05965.1 hypothetical protein E4T79_04085 [Streptococcus sp. LYSM12]
MLDYLKEEIRQNNKVEILDNKLFFPKRNRNISDEFELEFIPYQGMEQERIIAYISSNERIVEIDFFDDFLILKRTGLNTITRTRKENIRDLTLLKNIIRHSEFSYYEYDDFSVHLFRSRKYSKLHGAAPIHSRNYEAHSFYEYLERMVSFNIDNIKGESINDFNTLLNFNCYGQYWAKRLIGKRAENLLELKNIQETKKKYIPLEYIYYNTPNIAEGSFQISNRGNSNGIALGNSIDEALYFALLETYERDSLIRFWYDDEFEVLNIESDSLPKNFKAKVMTFNSLGYDLHFLLINRSLKIYVSWCLILDRSTDQQKLFSVSGFGASSDLNDALKQAFYEANMVFHSNKKYTSVKQAIDYIDLTDKLIQEDIGEYILRYFNSHQRSEEFRRILLESKKVKYLDIVNVDSGSTEQVVEELNAIYGEVFYYNMTPKILECFGLYCVKVLIKEAKEVHFYPVKNRTYRSDLLPLP